MYSTGKFDSDLHKKDAKNTVLCHACDKESDSSKDERPVIAFLPALWVQPSAAEVPRRAQLVSFMCTQMCLCDFPTSIFYCLVLFFFCFFILSLAAFTRSPS